MAGLNSRKNARDLNVKELHVEKRTLEVLQSVKKDFVI